MCYDAPSKLLPLEGHGSLNRTCHQATTEQQNLFWVRRGTLLLLTAHKPQWHFPYQNNHITCNRITHKESEHFLTVGSVHIQYCDLDSITQARATCCIKWNPLKFLMQYFQRKNNFLNLFFSYLIHKHYIAMYWAHHNYLWPH